MAYWAGLSALMLGEFMPLSISGFDFVNYFEETILHHI